MRKIIFKEIGMENYGPYQDAFILECPEDSLTLITGPNGVGKTIALDALSFTLYGITSKGERGDDVVNNVIGKNCHTWVLFDDDDGISYKIDRYHKHSKYKNTVHITKLSDTEPYKVGHREITAEVNKLICDRKTFMSMLMFGQKVKDFFTDLTDTAQKEIFWKILELLAYKYYSKAGKERLDEVEASIAKQISEIDIAKGILETLESQIIEENQKADKFEEDMKAYIEHEESLIANAKTMLADSEKNLDKIPDTELKPLQEKVFILKGKLENIGKDANDIKKDVETEAYKKVNEFSEIRNKKVSEIEYEYREIDKDTDKRQNEANAEYDKQVKNIESEINNIRLKITEAETTIQSNNRMITELRQNDLKIGSKCPTCLESITEASIQNINKIISDITKESSKIQTSIEDLKKKKSKLSADIAEVLKQKTISENNFAEEKLKYRGEKNKHLQAVEDRLTELKNQIADLANNELKEKIKDLEEHAQKMQQDLKIAETEYNEAELNFRKRQEIKNIIQNQQKQIHDLTEQLKVTREKEFDDSTLKNLKKTKQQKLETIKQIKASISDKEAEIIRIKFWIQAFSKEGIPSMLIDDAIPLMNKSMRKYLDYLSNGRYIVTFDTLSSTKTGEYRDKFSVNVLDTKTKVNNRKQLSGGQTRLIDIATILTLRDLKAELGGVEFNLFVFDELFDALDDVNIGYVCSVLNRLKQTRSLLVVAHRHQDELEADNHIQLS